MYWENPIHSNIVNPIPIPNTIAQACLRGTRLDFFSKSGKKMIYVKLEAWYLVREIHPKKSHNCHSQFALQPPPILK